MFKFCWVFEFAVISKLNLNASYVETSNTLLIRLTCHKKAYHKTPVFESD